MTTNIDSNFNRVMLKTVLKWFADANYPRAHFLVDNEIADLPAPFSAMADDMGQVTLNLAWQATRDMVYDDDGVEFSCKSNGIPYTLFVPYISIIGYITNYGFSMWSYMPTAIEPEADSSANDDVSPAVGEYVPKMVRLNLGKEEADTTRNETMKHLKLIQNHRTPVVDNPVDPKSPSYPFPVDRFQDYNDKHQEREATAVPNKEVIFTGDAAGIEFHSRKVKPRVRPEWMTVIDGGQK